MDPENAGKCFLPDSYLFILSSQCDNHSGYVVIIDNPGPKTSKQ